MYFFAFDLEKKNVPLLLVTKLKRYMVMVD